MNKIIGVTELQRKFRTVFDEVVQRQIPYILTRGSRPEAVLIPYEQYVKFVQADESGVLERVDRALARMAELNADYSDEEIAADLIQATKAVRTQKRKAS
ncbi:MAG TPA: type II toxin-antitoxin system Phd/YefM family antitoxin [Candidatus Binatia bacterium]|jgi:prevent-host-death family protein|nr:type II toxin-antitoxin system Phd/YefM family antitoxin [Candidatus Binatia bacterium]